MRKIAIICLVLPFISLSVANDKAGDLMSNLDLIGTKNKNASQNILFSYGLQYLGPSPNSTYEDGATYNRFNSGQDYKGDDTDPTSSYQLYHSFSLGYKISKTLSLSYSYTFQNDLHKNIEYETYNSDGSLFRKYQRPHGLSYNNQRINLFSNNLFSNNSIFIMSNFFYELATTDIAKDSNMNYGVGIQPIIIIYSSIAHLYHGIKGSIQRDYYKNQEYEYSCYPSTCSIRYQTLFVNVGGYIGHNISDNLSIHSEIIFDWDQKGNEVGTTNFNHNMDNVIEIGPKLRLNNNVTLSGKLQQALNKLNSKYSTLVFNFNLNL